MRRFDEDARAASEKLLTAEDAEGSQRTRRETSALSGGGQENERARAPASTADVGAGATVQNLPYIILAYL